MTVQVPFYRFLSLSLFFCPLFHSLFSSDWTRFRGPNGSGRSVGMELPKEWTREDYRWIIELPGVGHSSPVIWKNKVFTTTSNEKNGDQYVQCNDVANGNVIWKKKFQSEHYPHHKFNSFASATPCVDKDLLITSWTTKESNDLLCLGHDGTLKWRRDFGNFLTQHGNGFSPILHQDKVIVTHDHEGDSALLALDRKTGKTLWKTKRVGSKPSSSTPCIYNPPTGNTQVICNSMSHGCYGVDIENGKVLWETGLGSLDKRSVSSPVQSGGFFFATCGAGTRGSRLIAVKPPASPRKIISPTYTLTRNVPYVPTPLAADKLIFLLADSGIASCMERHTGKIFWRERLKGNFFASPIIINDVIVIVSRMGEVTTLKINDEKITVLGKSQLGELTHNTPAAGTNSLFFRTYSKLFCLPFEQL
ncbi:MAG: PQQ-binding-like beta-propeller repeat protein [Opitutales bacterium]